MANKVKEYKKLPGSKKGFLIGKYTLWQGADHLLHIFSRFGVEDYKRFYFSDIQAIITRKTIVGKIQNSILGCLILIFLLPVYIFDGGWSVFYFGGSATMFIFLLINLYIGPTCETTLMTAVQTEKLQSLHRLKNSCRVMDRLRLQIQQAQGALTPDDVTNIPARTAGRNPSQGPPEPTGIAAKTTGAVNGKAHMILFVLLLVNGVLVTSEFFISHVLPTILSSVASLSIGIFVIISLVRQHNTNLPGSLRTITWASLGFVGVMYVMGYVVFMVFAFKNPAIAYNQWEVAKAISNLSPWDSPLKLSYNILVLGGAFFLGIPGLIIHQRSSSRANKPASVMSAASGQTALNGTPELG